MGREAIRRWVERRSDGWGVSDERKQNERRVRSEEKGWERCWGIEAGER